MITYYSKLGEIVCDSCGAGFGAHERDRANEHDCTNDA